MSERVARGRRTSRSLEPDEQEDLLSRIRDRMDALREHGRAARDRRGNELRNGNPQIRTECAAADDRAVAHHWRG